MYSATFQVIRVPIILCNYKKICSIVALHVTVLALTIIVCLSFGMSVNANYLQASSTEGAWEDSNAFYQSIQVFLSLQSM